MKTKLDNFMKQTIESHELCRLTPAEAIAFLPGRLESLTAVYHIGEATDYFEHMGILFDDNGFTPSLNLANSFKKWLALQKHDVKAVNSLHEHKKAVEEKLDDVYCDIDELQNLPAAAHPFVEPTIKRLEEQAMQLAQLRFELSAAIDAVKATGKAKAVAA